MVKFLKTSKWPEFTIEDIRKRARILVIDDSDFVYLSLFERDGYTIEKWDDVIDLTKLESRYYDIILLDIQGVGKEESPEEQGFAVLRHLRKVSPVQIIIAYSHAKYNLKYQEFFSMADATLPKGKEYFEFKRVVDELLRKRFSLGFYVDKIIQIASPHVSDEEKLRALATKAILGKSTTKLQRYLEKNVDRKDVIKIALQVTQVAIGLAAVL